MNSKAIIGIATVLACAAIASASLFGSTLKSVAFADVQRKSERVDIYGVLDKPSIKAIRGATMVQFDLVEEKTNQRLTVVYDNPNSALPPNFPGASHARAAGVWDPSRGALVSNFVTTKCPSKYEEKNMDATTRKLVDQWKESTGQSGS